MNNLVHPLENPIRIKITGECNRNCFFCHKEGNMNIDTLCFNDELKQHIERLSKEYNIHNIALTGGEPLLYPNLEDLTGQLISCSGINRISLTTNGTFKKTFRFWEKMKENGLYKVNISIPDILESVAPNMTDSVFERNSILNNQFNMIKIFNEIGIDVKINVAVINDIYYTVSILNILYSQKDLKYDVVLLPNLSSQFTYHYSENIISEILKKLNYRYIGIRRRHNTSDFISVYKNDHSQLLYVKGTMSTNCPFTLKSICDNCDNKSNCQEGFYGIRLEQIKNEFFIRFCIHKNDRDVVIPLNTFFDTPVHRELKELWGTSE